MKKLLYFFTILLFALSAHPSFAQSDDSAQQNVSACTAAIQQALNARLQNYFLMADANKVRKKLVDLLQPTLDDTVNSDPHCLAARAILPNWDGKIWVKLESEYYIVVVTLKFKQK